MADEETPLTEEPAPEGEAPAPAKKPKKKKDDDDDDGGADFEHMTDEQKAEYIATNLRQPEDAKQYKATQTGLMNGRVVWSGSLLTDFWFFLQNNHIVLAIFRSHRIHPMRMWQRVLFLIDTLSFAFFTSVYIAKDTDPGKGGLYMLIYILLVVAAGVAGFILSEILVLLSVCPCTMPGHSYSKVKINGQSSKTFCKPLGKKALWVVSIVVCFLCIWFGVEGISEVDLEPVLYTWAISQVTGWLTAVGSASPTFLYAYYTQKKAFDGEEEQFDVFEPGLGTAYPSWKYVQLTHFHKLQELKGAAKEECLAVIAEHAKLVSGEPPAPAPTPAPEDA